MVYRSVGGNRQLEMQLEPLLRATPPRQHQAFEHPVIHRITLGNHVRRSGKQKNALFADYGDDGQAAEQVQAKHAGHQGIVDHKKCVRHSGAVRQGEQGPGDQGDRRGVGVVSSQTVDLRRVSDNASTV